MTNHYHMLVQTPDANLSRAMRHINGVCTQMSFKRLPSVLGDTQFVNTIKQRFFERKRHIEVPESKRLAPEVTAILNAVCEYYGMDKAQLRTAKRGTVNEARNMAVYLLRYLRGDSLSAIGKVFDIESYSTVSSIIARLKNADADGEKAAA